jgi:hypothetical protein
MRVYHFLKKKFGLENIEKRRLKIAIIDELNDPFEFLPFEISNTLLRQKILKAKTEYSKKEGLLCFSKSWSSPVQWAHYADNHQGLCLGFDIPDDHLNKIIYSSSRLSQEVVSISNNSSINEDLIKKLLTIKYYHWQYENEFRKFVTLVDADKRGKYFFEYFRIILSSNRLSLVLVQKFLEKSFKSI